MKSWKTLVLLSLVVMMIGGGLALRPTVASAVPEPSGSCHWKATLVLKDCETGLPNGAFRSLNAPNESICENETLPELEAQASRHGECILSQSCVVSKWC
ncbi:MAG: hypothetical protein K0U98_04545 [Deltaproteobacteria bacterium]|nr:hypothetical protein [Deltaproteobacteria bacterium]